MSAVTDFLLGALYTIGPLWYWALYYIPENEKRQWEKERMERERARNT